MEGKRFIHKIKLQNFLSYGSDGEEIELQPLNVLIGANTSGKSNLIEAIGILKATPTDLPVPFRKSGGINEFLWKGNKDTPIAEIKITVDYPQKSESLLLDYTLSFTTYNQRFDLVDEFIEPETRKEGFQFYYLNNYNGFRSFTVRDKDPLSGQERRSEQLLELHSIKSDQSVLSQIKDPNRYPELSYLSTEFSKISLYRYWQMGRDSEPRKAQPTDLPQHPLLEDTSNLGLFIKDLQHRIGIRKVIECLKKFYERAEELDVRIYGGTAQIFIREEGVIQPIPATRLSDGTLRYLFLMALLLDPTPPPLICIEEPELGLHPDILPTIAELLIEASQRTQLIVTTHSDALVSALSEYPESVVVCERDDTGTHLRRLKPDKLKDWLENYTLGDLWRMGEIGGNRW
ncbi:AAA family ATPase [Aphanizomenon flos-aquae]|uniref:AAA family ATPase n=1 Tax=Aphanizomenon flos-aquae FACHB-1040 TaxID=2692887 RepID=A0ABR8BUH3_APHFL|nr:AAA family ATPase [Aphanizomenon flos-aquae]MBD2277705.1 AAA family ATPase [Aphanizomenon flos-aquae FACHB-1040]